MIAETHGLKNNLCAFLAERRNCQQKTRLSFIAGQSSEASIHFPITIGSL
jgi:hypothetical protein